MQKHRLKFKNKIKHFKASDKEYAAFPSEILKNLCEIIRYFLEKKITIQRKNIYV